MERVRSRAITRASCVVNTGCGSFSQTGPASAIIPSNPPAVVDRSATRRVLRTPLINICGSNGSSTSVSQLLSAPFLKNRNQVSSARGSTAKNHCGRKK